MIAERLRYTTGPLKTWFGILIWLTSWSAGAVTDELLTAKPLDRGAKWAYALDRQAGLWLAYYDEGGELRLRAPGGLDEALSPSANNSAKSGLSLAGGQDEAVILWREKFPEKRLYLAHGSNLKQSPLELGAGTEPLTRMEIFSLHDDLHLLWYGERGDEETRQRYHIHYQRLGKGPDQTSMVQKVLPGIYPVWTHDDLGNLLVVSWVSTKEDKSILVRAKPAAEDEFGPASVIADTANAVPPSIRAFHHGGRWFVVWQDSQKDLKQFAGAFSDDFGQSWQRMAFDGLGDFAAGSIDASAGEGGRLYIALSGFDTKKGARKPDLRLAVSTDHGMTWKVQIPRPEEVATRFRAMNPVVVTGPESGQVLMAWEDWRNLRGQVYLSFSSDFGKTWEIDNMPLPQAQGMNRSLAGMDKPLYVSGGRYHLLVKEYTDDSLAKFNIHHLSLAPADLKALAQSPASGIAVGARDDATRDLEVAEGGRGASAARDEAIAEPAMAPRRPSDESALRERVQAYWKAMADKDIDVAYAMQDPFFRALVNKERYATPMGKITYRDPVIKEVSLAGPLARVMINVTAGVKPFQAKTGEMITRDDQAIDLEETWLWIDGNWYKEYYDQYNELTYTRY